MTGITFSHYQLPACCMCGCDKIYMEASWAKGQTPPVYTWPLSRKAWTFAFLTVFLSSYDKMERYVISQIWDSAASTINSKSKTVWNQSYTLGLCIKWKKNKLSLQFVLFFNLFCTSLQKDFFFFFCCRCPESSLLNFLLCCKIHLRGKKLFVHSGQLPILIPSLCHISLLASAASRTLRPMYQEHYQMEKRSYFT